MHELEEERRFRKNSLKVKCETLCFVNKNKRKLYDIRCIEKMLWKFVKRKWVK